MALPNVPAFTYGSGPTTLEFRVPVRPWVHGLRARGVSAEESAAGVPSVYVHRWEYPTRFAIRFPETQWPDVRDMLIHGMQGGTITYYPQGIAAGTSYVCYLVEPAATDDVQPTHSEAYPGWLELTIRLRRTTENAIAGEYYDG